MKKLALDLERIRNLRDHGVSLTAIGAAFNTSRQRIWQALQVAAGRCVTCGQPKSENAGVHCRRCREMTRQYDRRRRGWQEWRPGSRGRRPMELAS